MSETVAGILVDALENIGIRHIFGLIADLLNPLGDAVRHSKIEWIGVRHEEGGALAAAGQASSPAGSACVADQPDPAAPISSPAFMRQAATTRRFLQSPGGCRARCGARNIFKRPIRTCCSVTSRSIPRPFLARAGAGRHPSGHRRGLCRPRGRAFDAAGRRHARERRRQRFEPRHAQAAIRNHRQRGGHCRDGPPHRRGRQHRDHVRRRMSWRSRRITRALRSAQGAIDPFRQRQGHHALRRPALDGRHRHDRNEA